MVLLGHSQHGQHRPQDGVEERHHSEHWGGSGRGSIAANPRHRPEKPSSCCWEPQFATPAQSRDSSSAAVAPSHRLVWLTQPNPSQPVSSIQAVSQLLLVSTSPSAARRLVWKSHRRGVTLKAVPLGWLGTGGQQELSRDGRPAAPIPTAFKSPAERSSRLYVIHKITLTGIWLLWPSPGAHSPIWCSAPLHPGEGRFQGQGPAPQDRAEASAMAFPVPQGTEPGPLPLPCGAASRACQDPEQLRSSTQAAAKGARTAEAAGSHSLSPPDERLPLVSPLSQQLPGKSSHGFVQTSSPHQLPVAPAFPLRPHLF